MGMRYSVTRKCRKKKPAKLWHPLLLKRFPDGSYLHRAVVTPAWRGGEGEEGVEAGMSSSLTEKGDEKKNSFFVRCSGHIDALIVPFYWDAFDHRKFCISIKKP